MRSSHHLWNPKVKKRHYSYHSNILNRYIRLHSRKYCYRIRLWYITHR